MSEQERLIKIADVPQMNLPYDWKVKAIPSLSVIIVRYRIKSGAKEISFFLDTQTLPNMPDKMAWEIYPLTDGSVSGEYPMLFDIDDWCEMLSEIQNYFDGNE